MEIFNEGWRPYDTYIPLLWYGWHIPKGESFQKIYTSDIAATVKESVFYSEKN